MSITLQQIGNSRPASAVGVFTPASSRSCELTVRLASDQREVRAAQKLRYRVFYEEKDAQPTTQMAAARRDYDSFDHVCDHLLVLDETPGRHAEVVGTYRLLRGDAAYRADGFYSASEFDLSPLQEAVDDPARLLECGRSCVDIRYRTNTTIQHLWRGIADYVTAYASSYLFGCASLPGTHPALLAEQLSYLHHFHAAPSGLRVSALPGGRVDMDLMPVEAINPKRVWRALPALLRGYLRVGAFVGDGAFIDRQFGTTDVFVVLPVANIETRYLDHFTKQPQA